MNDYRPISVLAFILVIALTGVVFLYPAENPVKPTSTVEVIQTPILPEITEDNEDD